LVGLVGRWRHCLGIILLLRRGPLVCMVLGLHPGLVGLAMLLLHEPFNERQPLP
jgi:hypothetical protein